MTLSLFGFLAFSFPNCDCDSGTGLRGSYALARSGIDADDALAAGSSMPFNLRSIS
jgi:hypothetical protein